MEKLFDVFISHNSKDKLMVRQLAKALQQRGLKVWLDEWELTPGRPWQEALEEIIETARSAAVLVGEDGLGPWEIAEMRGCLTEFVNRKLPVMPVLLQDAPSQPKLPLFLKGFTWVDLRTGGLNEANLERLEWGITGRKPVPRPVSEPPPEPSPGVKQPESPAVPSKESKPQRNWLIGVTIVAVIGLLLEAIIRMQPAPPVTPPAITTQSSAPPTENATLVPGQEFQDKLKDGTPGPEMVKIHGGRFLMGSPADEKERSEDERQHEVQVADFAIGKYEVTVGQFKSFVKATQYKTEAEEGDGCYYWTGSEWKKDAGKTWRNPGFPQQTDEHPVVCVSWNDAMAYVDWLSKQTGQKYRLPTEAEWEYAARAGTQTARYWGDDPDKGCSFANGADQTLKAQLNWTSIMECQDESVYTAPVGRFRPNAWGLYDMLGNVWEWTCSGYDKDYGGSEQRCLSKGATGPCVLRGGSWHFVPRGVRGAARFWYEPRVRRSSTWAFAWPGLNPLNFLLFPFSSFWGR